MPTKYSITLVEGHLDLIQYLNGGVRPLITEDDLYFTFEMNEDNTDTQNADIQSGNDLYDERGFLKEERINLV